MAARMYVRNFQQLSPLSLGNNPQQVQTSIVPLALVMPNQITAEAGSITSEIK